jgi:hypothetical protein
MIEATIRDWHERAILKLRVLAENTEEKSVQNLHAGRPSTQEISDSDLFDDDEEEQMEEQLLSEFDREIQTYMNLSKEKYVEWRSIQSIPKHNVESNLFRLFWEDHKLLMPTLSKIALKVTKNCIHTKKPCLRSPDCRLHQMRRRGSFPVFHIRWARHS